MLSTSVYQSQVNIFDVFGAQAELGDVCFWYFTLQEGRFRAQNQEECSARLEGVEGALKQLKDGSSSATKFVFEIADTPGVGSAK